MPSLSIANPLIFAPYDFKTDIVPIKQGFSVITSSPGSTNTFARILMACKDPVVIINWFSSTGKPFFLKNSFSDSSREDNPALARIEKLPVF